MNNMSLVKITFGVVFAAATTFIVNANEILPAETVEVPQVEMLTFSDLLSEFDADSNGLLSEGELSASNNEALKIAFNQLDANQDANISEEEFDAFTSKIID